MNNSNVRESPIACDTLLITDAEYGVKRRVPTILLECSMRHLHNEIIASTHDGDLLGYRHAFKNDLIISETMICSLETSQLHPMAYHHKMMCGFDVCNTSNIFKNC